MDVAAVNSATLAIVIYDEARKALQLEFHSRGTYQYFAVPSAIHQALLQAPSKGSYFNQFVRGRFRYRRMGAVSAAAQAFKPAR